MSASRRGRLHLGTSGFAYDEWKGSFYPESVKRRDMLAFYAERFGSVEINYTFRRQPSERTLAAWREATPDGFVFSMKAHHWITHRLRLAGARDALASFIERAATLGPRLGVILLQCPPTLSFDAGLIESFLADLPPSPRFAFEFRHPSWDRARDAIATRAAWCVADTDASPVDPVSVPTSPFAYVRLRRVAYADHELASWGRRIAVALDSGADVFCYFKHEEKATGPRLAARLRTLIERHERTASNSASSST